MKKLILVLAVLIFSCSNNESLNSQQPIIPSDNSVIGDGEIKLIWSDEFEVDGPPSPQNWFLETIPPNDGSWWNEEDQYYTNRRKNSIIEDGVLKIIALREDYENKKYTSARMTTQNLFDFTYGEVHVRAKLPQGQGTWPAIWMLGNDIDTLGWPQCGEIDIMEHGNKEPGFVSSAVHLANENGDHYYLSGEQKIENELERSSVLRVFRAEILLTVYRSIYIIRMQEDFDSYWARAYLYFFLPCDPAGEIESLYKEKVYRSEVSFTRMNEMCANIKYRAA